MCASGTVVLSGVVDFIFQNTAGQIAVACFLALFFAAGLMILDPYTVVDLTLGLPELAIPVVWISLFVALLENVNIEEDGDFSQNAFVIALVFANCLMVVAAGAEVCMWDVFTVVTVREIRQPVPSLGTTASANLVLCISRHNDRPPRWAKTLSRPDTDAVGQAASRGAVALANIRPATNIISR